MNKFSEATHHFSGVLMVIGQTLISAFGVLIILAIVIYVEIHRVAEGISLFDDSSSVLGAAVLVLTLLTLEFIIHYVETKNGFDDNQHSAFSLRLFFQWLGYFVGLSPDWKPRLLSPAQQIKTYSKLLTITILALALAGSMKPAISSVQGTWIQGLQSVIWQSSLLEIVEWLSGVLFALTLVIGSQRITAYVAQRASETLATGEQTQKPKSYQGNITNLHETSDMPVIAEWQETYVAMCDSCGREFEKDSVDSAERALRAHKLHCEVK